MGVRSGRFLCVVVVVVVECEVGNFEGRACEGIKGNDWLIFSSSSFPNRVIVEWVRHAVSRERKEKRKRRRKEKERIRQRHACCNNNNNHTSSINIQRSTASINADALSASFLPIAPFRPYIPIPYPPPFTTPHFPLLIPATSSKQGSSNETHTPSRSWGSVCLYLLYSTLPLLFSRVKRL